MKGVGFTSSKSKIIAELSGFSSAFILCLHLLLSSTCPSCNAVHHTHNTYTLPSGALLSQHSSTPPAFAFAHQQRPVYFRPHHHNIFAVATNLRRHSSSQLAHQLFSITINTEYSPCHALLYQDVRCYQFDAGTTDNHRLAAVACVVHLCHALLIAFSFHSINREEPL